MTFKLSCQGTALAAPFKRGTRAALAAGLLFTTLLAVAQQPAPKANEKVMWDKMAAQISEEVRHHDGAMGVMLIDLTGGQQLAINADETFATASSIKIALLAELFRQDQAGGPNHLRDTYTIRKEDFVPDSSVFNGLTPGVTLVTNRDLATMVVAVSDNAATNLLIQRVGMDKVNALLDSLGLHKTRLQRKMIDLQAAREGRENISTPREMAALMEAIYRGKVLDAAHTKDLLDLLSIGHDSYMTRSLPDDVHIANKPGSLEGVRNDIGIIYATNRPFVLAVMSSYDKNERDAEATIGRIAAIAYTFLDRVGRASPYGRLMAAPQPK